MSPHFTALTQGQHLFIMTLIKLIHPLVPPWIYPPFGLKLHVALLLTQTKMLWYQAIRRIFEHPQGMLITLLLDFFLVTRAINPRRSLSWWNCSTLLNVINSHDRFWTSLNWVLWSREITSGYCEYLMDPRVSINVEKLFIVLSFHVHLPRFLLEGTHPGPCFWNVQPSRAVQ